MKQFALPNCSLATQPRANNYSILIYLLTTLLLTSQTRITTPHSYRQSNQKTTTTELFPEQHFSAELYYTQPQLRLWPAALQRSYIRLKPRRLQLAMLQKHSITN